MCECHSSRVRISKPDKSKSLAHTSDFINNNFCLGDLAAWQEKFNQLLTGDIWRKTSHI
jgi:hypothetical protein